MISERRRIADKYRSEGEGEASRISGEKDRELQRISSEAFKTSEKIKGKQTQKQLQYIHKHIIKMHNREIFTNSQKQWKHIKIQLIQALS